MVINDGCVGAVAPLIAARDEFSLRPVARVPGMRALTWRGNQLYAARGYELLRARVEDTSCLKWEPVSALYNMLTERVAT